MRDRESERLIVKAFCVAFMTLIINIILVHFMVYAGSVEDETQGMIRALDSTGHEVGFDEEHHALNAGPVRFIFDSGKLKYKEKYLYEDGSTLNPVENGEYILFPDGGAKEVSFYKKESDGETIKLHGGVYSVDFTEGIYDKPEAFISETERGYIITVEPLPRSYVYCGIRGWKNGSIEEIKEKTEFELIDDGIYTVFIYAEDGIGHRTYADLPSEIMIDNTPPVLKEAELPAVVSNKTMSVKLEADDELSGLKGIYVQTGDDEPVKADMIEISPPFTGSIYYWAVDNAGNKTKKKCLGEDIIADDTPPSITAEAISMDDNTLKLITGAKDALSGVAEVTISDGIRELYKGSGAREAVSIDISGMEYGTRTYEITSYDVAKNKAVSSFTLEKRDGIPPEIKIKGATDKGIYGRDVRLEFEALDDADSGCSVRETVVRYTLSGEYEDSAEYTDSSILFDKSGIYIVGVIASDSAGNTSKRSIAFAIDKDAPVIRGLLGLDGSSLKSFMMQVDDNIAEDESLVQVKVMLNGMDYDGSEVTKSGRYSLQVLAMDEFGNTASEEAQFEIKSDRKYTNP